MDTNSPKHAHSGYFSDADCNIDDFKNLIGQTTNVASVPHAARIEKNIPTYDARALASTIEGEGRQALMAEWADVLMHGAGVLVISQVYRDPSVLDEATAVFDQIIATEKKAGGGADHFAKAGANDRIWNSLQKLCMANPEVFARYHALPAIDAVCEAWLGPHYQMTAQVNLVRPGGEAQQAHRDYHLGFMTAETSLRFPAHVHLLSPVMTLQGGIAHLDIPIEAGPTKLLPFSQAYAPGYVAWRREEFRACFEERHVQLPLKKGDAICFNPALFHAGGANRTTDTQRLVNLLQVSSALGRAMETIDRRAMSKAIYPALMAHKENGTLNESELAAAISCCAEGYSFPTNLDNDPPVGGLAPKTQAQIVHEALASGWSQSQLDTALDALDHRQQS